MQEYSRNGHRQRLRKQYLANGLKGISDCNVLELYLSLVILRKDVKPLSYELMNRYKTLENVFSADKEELMTFKGIGEHTADAIGMFNAMLNRKAKLGKFDLYDLNKYDERALLISTLIEENDYNFVFAFTDSSKKYLGHLGVNGDFEFDASFKNEFLRKLICLKASFVIVGRKGDEDKFTKFDCNFASDIKIFMVLYNVGLYDYISCSHNNAIIMSRSRNKTLLTCTE